MGQSRYLRLIAACLLLGLAACAPAERADGSGPSGEELRQALLRTDREFSEASQAQGAAKAFADYMTEDAVMLPNGAHIVEGSERIKEFLDGDADSELTWEPLRAEVSASGDLGYTYGTYEYRAADADGKLAVGYGKYVSIWKRQPDGEWKWVLDTGNPSPAPSQPDAGE